MRCAVASMADVFPNMETLGEAEILELESELFPPGPGPPQEPSDDQGSQGGSQQGGQTATGSSPKKGNDAGNSMQEQAAAAAPPMIVGTSVGTPLGGTPKVGGTPAQSGAATPAAATAEPNKPVPYSRRSKVSGAKYLTPIARPKTVPAKSGFNGGYREFKTEQWRERGAYRWPLPAALEMTRQPRQFQRAQDVVPLQRTTTNAQANVNIELWTRSLRTKYLDLSKIGFQNPDLAPSAVRQMFDGSGIGFSGATPRSTPLYAANTVSSGGRIALSPAMSDWVESPVSTGRYALSHMDGARYEFDQTPRGCVPVKSKYLTPAAER